MELILKKTIKSGNASAVVLPKAWLNKRVKVEVVEKTKQEILYDVLDIVKSKIDSSEIIGVYLVGSYARKEEEKISDIDILIITEKKDLEIIKDNNYEILTVSLSLLNYKLRESLFPIGTMLKEAVPLLNSKFLKDIKIEVTRKNIKWFLDITKKSLKLVKDSINRIEKKKPQGLLSDAVAYSLILSLRTIYMINCLKNKKLYTKSEFIQLIIK